MTYALVGDIPASWDRYAGLVPLLRDAPNGLLLHVAGPTDEGFRIIEVWESEAAWRAFAVDRDAALALVDPDVAFRAVVRALRPEHVVLGAAWQQREVAND